MEVRVDPSDATGRSPLSLSDTEPDERFEASACVLAGTGGALSFLGLAGLLLTASPKPGGADAVAERILGV